MTSIPSIERVLLGPGPSPVPARVMRAMTTPVLGHLDPALLEVMDHVRAALARVFRAPEGSLALAVSGTGTSGMEAAVANLVAPGTRVVVVVNGYFGGRIAEMAGRYGAEVHRVEGEWGRAIDPEAVRRAAAAHGADVVAVVHAETSTGVRNPVSEIASAARERDALVLVDAVTSLGGMPVDVGAWSADVCYSGSQKCLGAPSGLAPIVFTPRALARRAPCRSFYLDIGLLQDYWVERKYHHTIAATLVYALREALAIVEEEGLEARWARHQRHHQVLTAGLEAMDLPLHPPPGERLWTLHTVRVPDGVDEAAVRRELREGFGIEIGAGMGPLAGKVWRVGLMGAGSVPSSILLLLGALERVLRCAGHDARPGAGTGAALQALG
ncbi:MAG TPA: alanine--glyoxylate aminotransferase family protein [Vicinamibacterales bacterium]|nr:alanine--glyoxylate aminotransferase family protein [Vicinamibacterales bacterium]